MKKLESILFYVGGFLVGFNWKKIDKKLEKLSNKIIKKKGK